MLNCAIKIIEHLCKTAIPSRSWRECNERWKPAITWAAFWCAERQWGERLFYW
jgi:hypothetical protein